MMDMDFWGTPHKGGVVHSGFHACAGSVKDRVLRSVDHRDSVIVTGHSLGGAVSTLLALDIAEEFPDKKVRLVTFGSPRVGSPGFAKRFASAVPDSDRYFMHFDVVTWLPGFMGFKHVGRPRRLPGFSHSLLKYLRAINR